MILIIVKASDTDFSIIIYIRGLDKSDVIDDQFNY